MMIVGGRRLELYNSALVQYLLKRIGLVHHKLKSATQLQQVTHVVIVIISNIHNVRTFPRRVVVFFRKILIGGMVPDGMSAIGIQKTLTKMELRLQ
jgi:hypothetical protein